MTAIQYVEALIEANWEESIDGRVVDVPEPQLVRESAQGFRKINLDRRDALLLRDGGITDVEPQSFAWQEERLVGRVTVDARTTGEAGAVPGRERLWGYRGVGDLGDTEAERYGGIQGEMKRIVDTVRKGDEEFDLVIATEQNDMSAEMGGQVWRGTTEITLDIRAAQIDPTP